MKVLYIDSVGQFGGASRSLFELVSRLKADGVHPFFLTQDGTVRKYYDKVSEDGIYPAGISKFNASVTGSYRGLRWLILLREIHNIPRTIFSVLKARRKWENFDIIHVNEIHDLFSGLLAKRFFGCPLVVQVRCCLKEDISSRRVRLLHWLLRTKVDKVITIDENTGATLPDGVDVSIVHNSFSAQYAVGWERDWAVVADHQNPVTIGFVGNVMRAKGILELIEAVSISRKKGNNVRLLVAGGKIRNLKGLKRYILKFFGMEQDVFLEAIDQIERLDAGAFVDMRGHVDDISSVYTEMDVVAFPSYFDAPGRPIFEAAFFKVPSISCISAPRSDTVVPGQTGLTVLPKDPVSLSKAIDFYSQNREEIRRQGENAFKLANKNFNPDKNAQEVMSIYQEILSKRRRSLPST